MAPRVVLFDTKKYKSEAKAKGAESMSGKRQIEARWGIEFWQLMRDFSDQGLPRCDVAAALGYDRRHFYRLLDANPNRDPFDSYVKAVSYLMDTGETMGQALLRMAREGRSWNYAARVMGYSDGARLKRAVRSRGIQTELQGKPGRPRSETNRTPTISKFTTGWPNWNKVYAMNRQVSE